MWLKLLHFRKHFVIATHALMFVASFILSFFLRFDFAPPAEYRILMFISLPMVLTIKVFIFDRFDLYQGWWRYVGMRDLAGILKASALSALAVMAVGYVLFRNYGYPRSIAFIDFILTVGMVGGARFSLRAMREGALFRLPRSGEREQTRILIVGAGDAGEALAREVVKHPEMGYVVVGFLDDEGFKQDTRIHGYRVLGTIDEAALVCESYEVQEIIITIPSASRTEMRRVLDRCGESGLKIKTIPGIDRLIDGRVTVNQLRKVEIEDLLGRDPVNLDTQAISQYLNNKKVLITGGAGSIGSEICRQVLAYGPRELILVDQWENGLFEMGRELSALGDRGRISYFVGDIADASRMRYVFERVRPEVVFHAAAYKHVPIMEENPGEAIKNNVGGTKTLVDVCNRVGGVVRFVMVSTDKAVNPSSVMGVTKRVAERYVQSLAAASKTKLITVRFGNVLGSTGSVIPIFKRQIAAGGPVTVTHPEMKRYFMTIPEASQLVLQAGSMGQGGEIFVLDMGEPVKILDLAVSMIKLSGLRPEEDIKIEFSGIRPGEKLFEELSLIDEHASRTPHPKVFVRKAGENYPDRFLELVDRLIDLADQADEITLKRELAELVPEYRAGDPGAAAAPPSDGARRDGCEPAASELDPSVQNRRLRVI